MSKKKASLKSLSPSEMVAKVRELEEQLFKLRLQKSTGQLTNTSLLRLNRKDLARIKTFQTQFENKSQQVKGK